MSLATMSLARAQRDVDRGCSGCFGRSNRCWRSSRGSSRCRSLSARCTNDESEKTRAKRTGERLDDECALRAKRRRIVSYLSNLALQILNTHTQLLYHRTTTRTALAHCSRAPPAASSSVSHHRLPTPSQFPSAPPPARSLYPRLRQRAPRLSSATLSAPHRSRQRVRARVRVRAVSRLNDARA